MAGKKLNVAGIANELQGASVFFPSPNTSVSSPTSSEESAPTPNIASEALSPEIKLAEPDIVPEPTQNEPSENTTQSSPLQLEVAEPEPRIEPKVFESIPNLPSKLPNTSRDASMLASEQASMLASNHDSTITKVKEAIRQIGKEVSYTRLTLDEKRQIVDVLYVFRSNGIKISENELFRIAINILLEDYNQLKERSILHQILRS